ncbi:MAG: hypothetical protein AAF984_08975 [Verrucomicrobiota bacterium]
MDDSYFIEPHRFLKIFQAALVAADSHSDNSKPEDLGVTLPEENYLSHVNEIFNFAYESMIATIERMCDYKPELSSEVALRVSALICIIDEPEDWMSQYLIIEDGFIVGLKNALILSVAETRVDGYGNLNMDDLLTALYKNDRLRAEDSYDDSVQSLSLGQNQF